MPKRTYHQYCPVAYTLDIVGERWTVLLIRELLFGPRRFTDLLNGLPGIGTNLLSQRLKGLEQAGLIQQRTLPPPASSTVYELTEAGQKLEEVLIALADCGVRYLQTPPPENHFIGTITTMLSLQRRFKPAKAKDVKIACEFHANGEVFYANVLGAKIKVGQGTLETPALIIHASARTLAELIVGSLQSQQAVSNGLLKIEVGDTQLLTTFFELFKYP